MKTYLKRIILFTFLAGVVDQILPDGTYKKYGRILSGFLLLLIFLQPLLVHQNMEEILLAECERFLLQPDVCVGYDWDDKAAEEIKQQYEKILLCYLEQAGYEKDKVRTDIFLEKGKDAIKKIVIDYDAGKIKEEDLENIAKYFDVKKEQVESR